ncbi:MAG: CHAT domain-containing protein [Nitrospira sp.]|nr:CHAT domain-containing protein [Nitrospira sp.]MDH4243528.1 CHAT domain-containing protein [Nitrospira sp.]MDH4355589.1 CHAT domain-containing protein [Nitrospira sp.]MDH5318081.1 CHAT domain-containing protein [Nitrospira sp.]
MVLFTVLGLLPAGCASPPDSPPQTNSLSSLQAYHGYLDEGAAAFRQQDYQKARILYAKALEEARRANDAAAIGGALARLGATYGALQDHTRALDLMLEAIPHLQRIRDIGSQAQVHWAIGEVYLRTGKEREALPQFEQSIQLADVLSEKATRAQEHEIKRSLAAIWTEKGLAHERIGEFAKSVEAHSTASSYFQQTEQENEAGEALLQAGRVSGVGLKDYVAATELFARAERLLNEGGDRNRAARAALWRGEALSSLGRHDEAKKAFERTAYSDVQGLPPEIPAEAGWRLGQNLEGRGQFKEALVSYQAALKHAKAIPQTSHPSSGAHLRPAILLSRGLLLLHLAHYDDATSDLLAAAAISKFMGNREGEALALASLGEVARWTADFQAGHSYYAKALAIYREQGAVLKQVNALSNLIEFGFRGGAASRDTEDYIQQGLALLQQYQNPLASKEIGEQLYATKISFLENQENVQKVKDILERESEWLAKWPYPSAEFLNAFGQNELLVEEIQFSEAEWRKQFPSLSAEYFHTAGNFYQRIGIAVLVSLNDIATANFWLTAASVYHSSVFSYREGLFELAKDFYYLGEVCRRNKDMARALNYFYRALLLGSTLKSPEIHWVHIGLGRTFADQNNLHAAIDWYSTGLGEFERVLRQSTIEATRNDVITGALYAYRPLASLLQDQYRHTQQIHYQHEAFQVNETLRARGFLDLLARSHAAALGGESETAEKLRLEIVGLQYKLKSAKLGSADHSVLVDRLQDLRSRWLEQQDATAQRHPRGTQLWSSPPVSLLDVQHALDHDTALLEYMVQEDKLVMWTITKIQFEVYEQPLGDGEAILRKFMGTLGRPLLTKDEAAEHLTLATSVYSRLIQPAEGLIRGKKHLIIVPDGLLHYLPFEALVIPTVGDKSERSRGGLSGAQYLLKQYQISYAPSASVAMALQKSVRSTDEKPPFPLVAFGDPAYEEVSSEEHRSGVCQGSWSRLEFSAEEVNRIAALWGIASDSPHINLREQASEKRLREIDLSQYRLLHFATHACVPDKFSGSEQPALVLSETTSEGTTKDGLLTFREILELKLKADLVVLSACKTNLGEFKWGEGLVGLSRAFFYAGASSLIVSFWDVQDQSTSLLMEDLYKRINQGERPAEALRQAKLALMNSRIQLKATGKEMSLESPFFWAPFVYIGPL